MAASAQEVFLTVGETSAYDFPIPPRAEVRQRGKHILTLSAHALYWDEDTLQCAECQQSCQSACKTSCTVGNQVCERARA